MWAVDFLNMITAQVTVKPLGIHKCGLVSKGPLAGMGAVGIEHHRFYRPAGELLNEKTDEWLITRHVGSCVYMRPANGRIVTQVQVEIPEPSEVEKVAQEIHDRGEPFEGTVLGWPCSYRPRRIGRLSTGQQRAEVAELCLGIPTVWLTVYRWLGRNVYIWTDDSAVRSRAE